MGGKGGPGVGGGGEEIENKSLQKGKYFGLEPIRSIRCSFPSSHLISFITYFNDPHLCFWGLGGRARRPV